MEMIKVIGVKEYSNKKRMFGLFKCDVCGSEIEKPIVYGRYAETCSYKCAAKDRKPRGEYRRR